MIVYRITAAQYAGDISGIGAEKYGGRWNRRGQPVVYASFSRALALLELLVNLKAPQDFSRPYTFTVIEVEDMDIIEISTDLLRSFGAGHHYEASRTLADDCWQRLNAMGISVPSAVLPYESNLVLNVQHPEFHRRVKVLRTEPYEIESRLQ
jgi:RES domain-containing protein